MSSFRGWIAAALRRPEPWVFGAVLAVRLGVLAAFANSPHFGSQAGDMSFYEDWALRILGGEWTDHHAFYGLPGYAFLLAAIYGIVGVHPAAVFIFQAGVDSLTGVVIFTITRIVLSATRRNGSLPQPNWAFSAAPWVAALGWGFFRPAETLAVILMPTSWMICAFWLCVWLLLRVRKATVLRPWAALGVFTGVVATMIATILFLLPLMLAAMVKTVAPDLPPRRRWPRAALAGGVLIAGVFAGTAPVWMHNYFVAHERVLLSAHGGINFWIGNYPQANGYPKIPEGLPGSQEALLEASIQQAEAAVGHPLTRAEVSRYWSDKAWTQIRQHPAAWLRLLGIKVRNFWNVYPYDDLTMIALLQEEGVLPPGIGFGVAAAFGLAGLVIGVARNGPARWVAAAVLLHLLSLLPVFVTERYRLAAAPGLLILGSYGLWWLVENLRARRWVAAGIYLLLLGAASAAVFLPKTDVPLSMEPYNLASAELAVGQLDRAQRHLEAAQALAPNSPQLLATLGALYQKKGDRDHAKMYYGRTLERDPRNDQALTNLGVLALQEERWDLAGHFLSRAVASDPRDAASWYLLATARWRMHQLPEARAAIDQALRLQPRERAFLELRQRLTEPEGHTD